MKAAPERPETPTRVIWHDAECGGYAADLPFWERLATERAGAGDVLDLGAGTGRVALHLAERGHRVVAVDSDQLLLEALGGRAASSALSVELVHADVRELDLGRRFELILAPMQLLHLLGGERGRARAWPAIRRHLAPGGLLAAAVLREPLPSSGRPEPLPDVREVGGWVHASMPTDVRVDESSVELDRLRQIVSPAGRLSDELSTTVLDRLASDALERETLTAGLAIVATEPIDETAEHVGSLLLRVEATGA